MHKKMIDDLHRLLPKGEKRALVPKYSVAASTVLYCNRLRGVQENSEVKIHRYFSKIKKK